VRARIASALPGIVALWCAGVLVLLVRYLGGWRLVQRWTARRGPLGDGEVAGTARPPRAPDARQPLRPPAGVDDGRGADGGGWLRPAILCRGHDGRPDREQLEAILAHELAHVRRYDYLASLLRARSRRSSSTTPAVWWVSQRMRVERELCCDDEAVTALRQPIEYARALAGLEALRPAPALAPAATGGPLFERIARLVALPRATVVGRPAPARLPGLRGAGLALTGVTSLRAQATSRPSERETAKKRAPGAKGTTFPPPTAEPAQATRRPGPSGRASHADERRLDPSRPRWSA
jgi:hypothetical protein